MRDAASVAELPLDVIYLLGEAHVDGLRHLALVAGVDRGRRVLERQTPAPRHGLRAVLAQVSNLHLWFRFVGLSPRL